MEDDRPAGDPHRPARTARRRQLQPEQPLAQRRSPSRFEDEEVGEVEQPWPTEPGGGGLSVNEREVFTAFQIVNGSDSSTRSTETASSRNAVRPAFRRGPKTGEALGERGIGRRPLRRRFRQTLRTTAQARKESPDGARAATSAARWSRASTSSRRSRASNGGWPVSR